VAKNPTRDEYLYPAEIVEFKDLFGEKKAILKSSVDHARLSETDTEALHDLWLQESQASDESRGYGREIEIIPSAKMSKSKKNVVDPVRIVSTFGADTARWFMLSDSPPERDVEWTDAGAEAAHKHLSRIWRMADELAANAATADSSADEISDTGLARTVARTIRDVTDGIEGFAFNTSVAKLYTLAGAIQKSGASPADRTAAVRVLVRLMAPMTPHLAEEVWAMLGGNGLVAQLPWPKADPALLVEDTVTLPIQINGKRRSELVVAKDLAPAEVERLALADQAVQRALSGAAPKKLIVVPGRIINVVL
jgi:leucyl-tRNA synthetase